MLKQNINQITLNQQIQKSFQLIEENFFLDAFDLMDDILTKHLDEIDNNNKNTFIFYNNYIVICQKVKKYKKGLELFEKIKDIAWKNTSIFHAVACLYIETGELKKAMEQIRNCYLYETGFYWRDTVLKDPDLKILSQRSDFQELANTPILRNTHNTDFKNKIIGSCKKIVCPRKKEKCTVSGEKIEKGQQVFEITWFFGGNCYVLPKYFKKADFYENYQNKFLKNNYDIKEFDTYGDIWHPIFKRLIRDFDFDKALDSIFYNPPIKQTPFWYQYDGYTSGVEFASNMQKMPNTKEYWGYSDVAIMISILFKIGYKEKILERIKVLPKHSVLILAMADDLRFQEKVGEILNLPDLSKILNLFRDKKKFSLDDMLKIIKFGKENPMFLKLLGACLNQYQAHYISFIRLNSEFSKFVNKNIQLCYFFISRPDLHLFLYNLLTKNSFPNDQNSYLSYMEAYYYRATIFYVLFSYPDKVDTWFEYMKKDVSFFPSGSPKGFINDTKKMIDQYKKSKINKCK